MDVDPLAYFQDHEHGRGKMQPEAADPEQRRWANKIEALQLETLTRVQATAEKWAGTVGTLTGLFSIVALIKGREDINELTALPKTLVGICLGIALLSAFMATLKAALAAQGVPMKFSSRDNPANNPDSFRGWYLDEAQKAADRLNQSRMWVIPAFLFLALAIGITWFWPIGESVSKGPNVLVTQKAGTVLCGELMTDVAGKLSLKLKKGEPPINLNDAIALNTIGNCPKPSQQ